MKFFVTVLAILGAFITALGVLPDATNGEDRMSNALIAFLGIIILGLDAFIIIAWLIIRGPQ